AIVFFAYIGFDALSTTAEETKNPKRDLPIGILGSLAICTVLYILATVVLVGMVPYTDFQVGNGVTAAEAERRLSEPFGYAFEGSYPLVADVIRAGAITGITSVLFVMLMGAPRVFFSLARDGLLPESWAKVHPKFGTPALATAITGGFVAIAASITPIGIASSLTSIGTLFVFAIVCVNVIVLRYREPGLERPFKVPLNVGRFPVLAAIGVVTCAMLMLSLEGGTKIAFLAWIGIGLMAYSLYGIRNSRLRQVPAVAGTGGDSRSVPVKSKAAGRGEGEVEVVLEEMR
ncbi:MAG TPA: amino acid permease, partial [Candidatus Thermoplasmatota archaeon]|nr:amino acid permease [Candidatus Thermoplasmatota archaeon]